MLKPMLQLLHHKRSSCTLVVTNTTEDTDGCFYVKNGMIVAVLLGEQIGYQAALEILAWQDTTVTVYALPAHVIDNISLEQAAYIFEMPNIASGGHGAPTTQAATDVSDAGRTDAAANIASNRSSHNTHTGKGYTMSIQSTLEQIMEVEGAVAVAIVDWTSGMALGSLGQDINIELAAAGNSNVVRAKMRVLKDLGLKDRIEDMLITLGNQYHLIRLLESNSNLFMYVVLNRSQANLAMSRYRLSQAEHGLVV